MKPIEVVVSLLPCLTEAEKTTVREQLQCSPCTISGHRYGKAIEVITSIFAPKKKYMICARCGHKLEIQ